MSHWPNRFPTKAEEWVVNWDDVFGGKVEGSVKVLVHDLKQASRVNKYSLDILGNNV